ncbi:MAG: MmgE/PrpD family protein [Pararhodobacter sp.]
MPAILDEIVVRASDTALQTAAARQAAQEAIADTFACMIAGQTDGAVRAVRAGLARGGVVDGPCTVIGGGSAPAPVAAMINGTAAHALDFDDNFSPALSHASAVLVPALLAAGELRGSTGDDLIRAYLVGLEAQALVGQGVQRHHYTTGWHATSTVGMIGTAAGVGWLLGLDRAGMVQAMSLGVSMAAGVKGQFGTPAKPFHAGMAARNAVDAALLAAGGLTGRRDILEAPQGFGALFNGGHETRWAIPDGPHIIETEGLAPKLHPCCGSTHYAIDMVMDLRRAHGFNAADVASVHVVVGLANYRNLPYPDPQDEMQARFSMQYCLARALTQPVLGLADFTPDAIRDPAIRSLLSLTMMAPLDPEEERASARPCHRITVTLTSGQVLQAQRAYARGTRAEPFSPSERHAKFLDCVTRHLGADGAEQAWQALCRLEEHPAPARFLAGPLPVSG